MPFLVVGTPWKRPRSSRLCCPDCGDGWFGGISSTRTATLRMRLRNSCGSESSACSTTSTKCSRFILHPLINKGTLTPGYCVRSAKPALGDESQERVRDRGNTGSEHHLNTT